MLCLTLFCNNHHTFEALFFDADSFAEQQHKKLIACPYCESITITQGEEDHKKEDGGFVAQMLGPSIEAALAPDLAGMKGFVLPHANIHAENELPQFVKLYQPIAAKELNGTIQLTSTEQALSGQMVITSTKNMSTKKGAI